jgi:branched-chain amino acid transport system permease protein
VSALTAATRSLLGPRLVLPALAAAAALAPLVLNRYLRFVVTLFFIYAVVALGLNVLLGYAGQFAFANAAFFGWGAYTTALLQVKLGMPFALALALGALGTAAVGALVGLPALRLRGLYLAIVTLAFGEVTYWAMIHWSGLTGGASGLRAPAPDFAALGLPADLGMYYLCLAVAVALFAAAWGIVHSRIGRAFVAVRDSEIAAQALSVNLTRVKTSAFVLSAFYAGVAGGLHSAALRFVAPESFDLFQMVLQFCMVVIGGLGSVMGAALGAGLVLALRESLRAAVGTQEILFGALLITCIVFVPRGLVSLLGGEGSPWIERLHWERRRGRPEAASWEPSR